MDRKNVADTLEGYKEEHRLQYDYFKYAIVLSLGIITAIVALFERIINRPQFVITVLFSLACLLAAIIISLFALPVIARLIVTISATRLALQEDDSLNLEKFSEKMGAGQKRISRFTTLLQISMVSGLVLFVIFLALNLLRKNC